VAVGLPAVNSNILAVQMAIALAAVLWWLTAN
jgi:hypothetical protein